MIDITISAAALASATASAILSRLFISLPPIGAYYGYIPGSTPVADDIFYRFALVSRHFVACLLRQYHQ